MMDLVRTWVREGFANLVRLLSFSLHVLFGFGHVCRFQPTCSQHMAQEIRKAGVVRGVVSGMAQLVRCHPFAEPKRTKVIHGR